MRPTFGALLATLLVSLAVLSQPQHLNAQRRLGRGLSKDVFRSALDRGLDTVIRRAGRPRRSVAFGVNLFLAHEYAIDKVPVEPLKKAVTAFKEAGVSRIDINMGLFPWIDGDQATIAKYDALIEHIRSMGLQVAINPQYSRTRHRVNSLAEWRTLAFRMFGEVSGRYHPDILVVVHEPTTMASRAGFKAEPQEWASFARDAARLVRQKSPKTRIGAGGLASERKYFDAFLELREIDVMTMDIYQLRQLPNYEDMAAAARKKGKPVYIEETWRPSYVTPRPGMSLDEVGVTSIADRAFEDIDSKWLRAIAAWAAVNDVEAVTPFWMQTFFAYDGDATAVDAGYIRQTLEAIESGARTNTYQTLRDLARR